MGDSSNGIISANDLASAAAVYDASRRGRLRVSGEDAIDLLDRLTTNALSELSPGEGMATVLTTNKGRIIDLLRVLHRGDELLILTSAGTQERVIEWVDFYTFAEDVSVEDVTARTAHRVAVGGGAADAVRAAFPNVGDLQSPLSHAAGDGNGDAVIIRADMGEGGIDAPLPAYEIITPLDADIPISASRTLSEGDMKALRIAQGIPSYPNELNEERNPLEANLKPQINFNKGCYIGQEVVARLNTYGRVQRFLFRLDVAGGAALAEGAALMSAKGGEDVGFVTSATPGAALAYLRKRFVENGGGALIGENGGGESVSAEVDDIRPRAYFEDPGALER